jgi:hypothetical protein
MAHQGGGLVLQHHALRVASCCWNQYAWPRTCQVVPYEQFEAESKTLFNLVGQIFVFHYMFVGQWIIVEYCSHGRVHG